MSYVIPEKFLENLKPEFKEKLVKFYDHLINVEKLSFEIVSTRRTFEKQGYVYILGRTESYVEAQITKIIDQGCTAIAQYLCDARNEYGDLSYKSIATEVYPGCSWHNWGEAADSAWIVNGQKQGPDAVVDGKKGWMIYAESAQKFGLTPGGFWPNFKDWPHVQNRKEDNPLNFYTMQQIDKFMHEGKMYLDDLPAA